MTWQNAAAVANALDKLGDAPGTSKTRRREDVVASYWQRYCAKNDTIGFYGPLAWGRIEADGAPRLAVRSGALVRERGVHLESWGVQALAAAVDPSCGCRSGRAPRTTCARCWKRTRTPGCASAALAALARLEAARDATRRRRRASAARAGARRAGRGVHRAHRLAADAQPRPRIRGADARLSGLPARPRRHARPAVPRRRRAGGDGGVRGGPLVLRAHPGDRRGGRRGDRPARPRPVRRRRRAAARPDDGAAAGRSRTRSPSSGAASARCSPTPSRRRWRRARPPRSPTSAGAWPQAGNQSVDLQLAARDADAIAAGDYLAVVGDMHPGDNPLAQGLFGLRHPGPGALRAAWSARTPAAVRAAAARRGARASRPTPAACR